jgi:hypothetical protein
VAKTAPLPILGTLAKLPLHGIPMNIPQLFDKLIVIANIEIVITFLPQMLRIAD